MSYFDFYTYFREDRPMSTKSDVSDQLMLALEIIKRLHTRMKKDTQEILLELQGIGYDKSERSLQRLLEKLTAAGLIECDDRSKPFGYKLIQKDVLSLGNFTEKEALLLAMVQDHLSVFLPPSAQQGLTGLFKHLNEHWAKKRDFDSSDKACKAEKAKNWRKKVRFVPEIQQLKQPTIDADVLSVVSEALYHDQYLTLHYQKAPTTQDETPSVKVSQRIMPLGLVQQGNRMYLVCRYHGYDNYRNLALHRIQKAHTENEHFEYPKGFCLKTYDGQGSFGFGQGECRVRFCMSANAVGLLIETPLSNDQTLEYQSETADAPAHYKVTATVVNSLLLDRWLRGFDEKTIWGIQKQSR